MRQTVRAVRLRVGKKVLQLRRLHGWSQQELADLVGNTAAHIGLIERGEANVTLDILTTVAAKLSVDVSELLRATSRQSKGKRTYLITQPLLDQVESTLQAIGRVKRAESGRRRREAD